jgi:septal ring-binding cell division protein DamX
MDTTELQTKLASLNHLAPSQHEWLQRLLFQLAFNDSTHIQATGAEGSGKSTLAMAVAELFSGQYNVAMLNPPVDDVKAQQQLMQQWFGSVWQAEMPLVAQIAGQSSSLPLLLIIDDAERFSATLLQQFAALPCILFCFSERKVAEEGLVLTLGQITAADAEYLLQHENLNSIELAQRLASADGNLHKLLQAPLDMPAADSADSKPQGFRLSTMQLVAAVAGLLIIALLAFMLWPQPQKKAVRIPVSKPVETLVQQAEQPVVTEIKAAETESVAQIMQPTSEELMATDTVEPDSVLPDNNATGIVETEIVESTAVQKAADAQISTPAAAPELVTEPEPVADYLFDEQQLLSIDKQQVALQLAVLSSDAALQRFKLAYPQLQTLTYQRSWQGKMQLVLLLAPFSDAAAAKAERDKLPEALRATGPFVKAMQSVQAEVKAQQRSRQNAGTE